MSRPPSEMPGTPFAPRAISLRNGRIAILREAHAGDGERVQAAMRAMSAESRYTRFMSALREATPQMLERATRADPRHALQLLAVAGEQELVVGGARFDGAPDGADCEFAIMVQDGWQGLGLARALLAALMQEAGARGFQRMEGYILATNASMLGLARKLGFAPIPYPEDPTVRQVRCELETFRRPAGI